MWLQPLLTVFQSCEGQGAGRVVWVRWDGEMVGVRGQVGWLGSGVSWDGWGEKVSGLRKSRFPL